MPAGVDAAEAAALILSWTTAYQLLHRAARVQRGQRVLVQGAAGAVGQALLVLGRLAGLELWGTARGEHAALIRELGATPIDYQREDFTRVLPGGFDVVFDGIGEDGYRRSFAALKRGGLLCAYGYTAGVQAQRRLLTILMWIARLYLERWRWLPGGKRPRIYSINLMRARIPAGSGRTWSGSSACWQLAPSGRASPSGSPSMRSPRHTAVSRRAVSRASSSCARTSRRDATGCCLSASRAPLRPMPHPRPELSRGVILRPARSFTQRRKERAGVRVSRSSRAGRQPRTRDPRDHGCLKTPSAGINGSALRHRAGASDRGSLIGREV